MANNSRNIQSSVSGYFGLPTGELSYLISKGFLSNHPPSGNDFLLSKSYPKYYKTQFSSCGYPLLRVTDLFNRAGNQIYRMGNQFNLVEKQFYRAGKRVYPGWERV